MRGMFIKGLARREVLQYSTQKLSKFWYFQDYDTESLHNLLLTRSYEPLDWENIFEQTLERLLVEFILCWMGEQITHTCAIRVISYVRFYFLNMEVNIIWNISQSSSFGLFSERNENAWLRGDLKKTYPTVWCSTCDNDLLLMFAYMYGLEEKIEYPGWVLKCWKSCAVPRLKVLYESAGENYDDSYVDHL